MNYEYDKLMIINKTKYYNKRILQTAYNNMQFYDNMIMIII